MKQHSSLIISKQLAIWMGISGILGSLLLFAGDMLFYYHPTSSNLLLNMANASEQRIFYSGIFALLSAWLYSFAAGQIYYAFQPASRVLRLIAFVSFLSIMITYGVVHGAYVAIATSAKNAVSSGMPIDSFSQLAIDTNNALRVIAYIPFALFTLVFIPTVWLQKTFYPRWIILFSPVVLFALKGPIASSLSGIANTIIVGGYLNLILFLFFSISTITLWRNSNNMVSSD